MYCNHLTTRSLAAMFVVVLITGVPVSSNVLGNQNIEEAFNATQQMFGAIVACREEVGKSSCPDAIEAGQKAKRYAEAALSDEISSLAKAHVQKAVEILETTLDELKRNDLKEAEQHAAYALGALDEARKAL
jgi:predicted TIM-barrel enzyme